MDTLTTKEIEENIKLFEALSAPLPEDAIQHMNGAEVHKGYDADGYKCQYCINQFNNVLGDRWGFEWEIRNQKEGIWGQKKTACYDLTVEVKIWIFDKKNIRSCVGGHISGSYNDALSGAITNGFKRAARFWGVGRQAYEGILGTNTEQEKKKLNRNKNNQARQRAPEKKSAPAPAPKKEISLKAQYYETVNNLQLSAETISEYKKYLIGIYGTGDVNKFDDERIKDQLEILAHILSKYENKIFIEKAFKELSKDSNYSRPIKMEIGRIMKTIYGKNIKLIMEKISTMTTQGLTDLDKMNLNELHEVLDLSNVLLGEFREMKK